MRRKVAIWKPWPRDILGTPSLSHTLSLRARFSLRHTFLSLSLSFTFSLSFSLYLYIYARNSMKCSAAMPSALPLSFPRSDKNPRARLPTKISRLPLSPLPLPLYLTVSPSSPQLTFLLPILYRSRHERRESETKLHFCLLTRNRFVPRGPQDAGGTASPAFTVLPLVLSLSLSISMRW